MQIPGNHMQRTSLMVVLISLSCAWAAQSEDWPQWRGPTRDGVWTEQGVLRAFPPGGLKFRWRAEVGLGMASPIVAQGRVFLTDVQLAGAASKERVLCYDAASGKRLWTYEYDAVYPDQDEYTQGPIATPVYGDGKVYTIGRTELLCLDAAAGKLLWQKSLDKEYQAQERLTYASPLIEGNRLIIYAGRFSGDATACVIAIDKDTGQTAWRAVTDYAAMSSPIVVSAAGKRQVIVWSQHAVTSIDAATGGVCWQEETRPVNQSSAVATPVVQGDKLLVGGLMMKLDGEKPSAAVLWPQSTSPSRRNLSNTSTPLLRGDHVFSVRTSGHFVCLSAVTGEELWRTDKVTGLRSGAAAHLTTNGDRTILFTDQGDLILAELSGTGYNEIGRVGLVAPTFLYEGRKCVWPPPAFADRCVFARSDKELVCASLAE